jgi:DNA-binding response OmpR family regulator
METLLLVENELKLVKLMKPFLEKEGYFVIHTSKGSEVIPMLHSNRVDKVILDVMLDDLDGWRVLRDIKSQFSIPVIMLSARSEESDRLFGFELGCDDYMTKPFSMKELIFRLEKLSISTKKQSLFSFDKMSYQVIVNDQKISITKTEHDLIGYFLEHEHEVISRERLLEHVWGFMYEGETRVVDTTITRLRKKLSPLVCIHTVFGVGYKWEIEK